VPRRLGVTVWGRSVSTDYRGYHGSNTVNFLSQVAERTDRLEVVCRKCNRRGVLSVARLLQEHGPAIPMPQLRIVMAADCERLKAAKVHDPCGCHFPELPGLLGVQAP
jgi:thymidine kinase